LGIIGIVLLQWSGAAILAILAFLLLLQNWFPSTSTGAYTTGSLTPTLLLFYGAWFLIYIGKGLWRMQPGPYVVAIFFYVLAALAQLAAVIQGYAWISVSALLTIGIVIYLLHPRVWWTFYPKPHS
jgi:hypothetical protein